jgi:hypothetical protein
MQIESKSIEGLARALVCKTRERERVYSSMINNEITQITGHIS